jgi:iron complex transport system permease protein
VSGTADAGLGARRVAEARRLVAPRPGPFWLGGASAFLAGALLVGVLVGPVDISAGAIARAAVSHLPFVDVESPLSAAEDAIVFELRLPRAVLGAVVGAMLAVSGAAYQGAFRNPLADPYLLGAASGAGLGVTLVVAYAPGAGAGLLMPLAAFVGAAGAVAAAYAIGRSAGGRSAVSLVLAGVVIASFVTALQTFVQQQNVDTVQEVYSWILGRLSTAGWREVLIVLPYAALSTAALLVHARLLDVLSVGDAEASSLGIDVRRVRVIVIAAATIGTAAAVAVSGLIGFVGIIVPHMIRMVAGGSYRSVLPLSLLCGGGFLVLADVLARTVLAPGELPIGVVTAFFGAPFFALVLRRSRVAVL